jgi:hypothetical protein
VGTKEQNQGEGWVVALFGVLYLCVVRVSHVL